MGLLGGAAALGLGLAGNRLIWRSWSGRGTAWFVPLWEETVKTGFGLLVGQVAMVHGLFGLGEAILEYDAGGPVAAGVALVSHMIYGVLTVAGWRVTGSPFVGWIMASAAHLLWNQLVLRFSSH